MEPTKVKRALDHWLKNLDTNDPRHRHHQVEAMWAYRNVEQSNLQLLEELLQCENHNARAAATRQLRYWHSLSDNGDDLLTRAARDNNGLVRLEAAIACSYIGTKNAFEALKVVSTQPNEKHLSYAIKTSFGSSPMKKFWDPKDLEETQPLLFEFLNKQKIANQIAEKSKANNKNWIFINGGVGNYNTERYINNYFENWSRLEFSDIIVHFFVNDTEIIETTKVNFFTNHFHLGVIVWKLLNSYISVFNPEKEKSQFLIFVRGIGREKLFRSPCMARFSIAGPPG